MINTDLVPYISLALTSEKFGYTEGVDEKTGLRSIVLEGEFQNSTRRNKNDRYYAEELLLRENNKLITSINMRGGHPMGLNHPIPDPNDANAIKKLKTINLENACALTTYLEFHNGIVYGKAKAITGDFSTGDKLAALVRQGFKPGVSSRGVGPKPIYRPGGIEVPNEWSLICYDIVTDPSTHNAILEQAYHEEYEAYTSYRSRFYDVLVNLSNKHIK